MANVLGLAVVWRRRAGAADWSRVRLAFGALAVALGAVLFLSRLHASLLQRLDDLGREAELLVEAALPPAPSPRENAAPLIEQAAKRMRATIGDDPSEGRRRWKPVLDDGEPIDLTNPKFAAYLAEVEPALELLGLAAELPRCQPAPRGEDSEWFLPWRMSDFRALGRALALRARVRFAEGRPEEGANDLVTLQRLADHLFDTPVMISAIIAGSLRQQAERELLAACQRGELEAERALTLLEPRRPALAAFDVALRLEVGLGLDRFSRLGAEELRSGTCRDLLLDSVRLVGLDFMLEPEIEALREVEAELRKRARVAIASGNAPEPSTDAPAWPLFGHAPAALGLHAPAALHSMEHALRNSRYVDAHTALTRAALLGAARSEAEGALPTNTAALARGDARIETLLAHIALQPLPGGGLRLVHGAFPGDPKTGAPSLELVLEPAL